VEYLERQRKKREIRIEELALQKVQRDVDSYHQRLSSSHYGSPRRLSTHSASSSHLLKVSFKACSKFLKSFGMVSSILKQTLGLAIAITVASAASSSFPIYPPTSHASSFTLVANITGADLLGIRNYVVSTYHMTAGIDWAVLTPSNGAIFYENGTAEDVRFNRGHLYTDGGTPVSVPSSLRGARETNRHYNQPVPYGVSIYDEAKTNSNREHEVLIGVSAATSGIGLAQFPSPIPFLQAPGAGSFYACDNTLAFGPAIQILYKYYGETIPEACEVITLLPQCSPGTGVEHPFAVTLNCYEDVAGINWQIYSA
jgi:hypothetical protein